MVGEGGAYGVELVAEVIGNRRWRRHRLGLKSRGGNRVGRAGPGQQWAGPKLARFFRAKILTAQLALKTGPVWPNSLFKAKKIRGGRAGPGHTGPYRAGPNLARFFSSQKFNGPARP